MEESLSQLIVELIERKQEFDGHEDLEYVSNSDNTKSYENKRVRLNEAKDRIDSFVKRLKR